MQNPSDCKAYTGDTVVLNASFGTGEDGARTKTHPIFVKWYKNNEAIPDATEETLTIYNASENDGGHYYCMAYYGELGDALLSAKSSIAQVEIDDPGIIFSNGVLGGRWSLDENALLTLFAGAKTSSGEECVYQW